MQFTLIKLVDRLGGRHLAEITPAILDIVSTRHRKSLVKFLAWVDYMHGALRLWMGTVHRPLPCDQQPEPLR